MDFLDSVKEKLTDEEYSQLESHLSDMEEQVKSSRDGTIKTRKKTETRIKELEAENSSLKKTQHELFAKLGIESVDELENLDPKQGQVEIEKQFKAKLNRLENDLKEQIANYQTLEAKHKSTIKGAALQKVIDQYDWIDKDLIKAFIESKTVLEDDEVKFTADDGLVQNLTDGIKLFAKEKPHLLNRPAPTGSGFRPDHNGTIRTATQTQQATLARDQFDKLSNKEKMAFMKNGGILE
jgi:predicted RNase H-like nuclease (RuvC/YqgF family)